MNGKGSTPRNLGPKFRANYNRIFRAGKKRACKVSLATTANNAPPCARPFPGGL